MGIGVCQSAMWRLSHFAPRKLARAFCTLKYRIFFKIQMFSLTLQIGMARPAARRLLDVIKKKRRKSMVAKLLPKAASTLSKGFNVGGGGGGTLGRKKNADQPSNVSIPAFLDILKKTQA